MVLAFLQGYLQTDSCLESITAYMKLELQSAQADFVFV
jgi:hypothetical protein